jgi:Tol biopolymer transport system component
MSIKRAKQLLSPRRKKPAVSLRVLGVMWVMWLLAGCSSAPARTAVPRTEAHPTPVPEPTVAAATLPPLSGSGGGWIAFSSRRDGNYEIYVMNADGTDLRRLTETPHDPEGGAAWSPDCTQIAFSSSRESGGRVRVMNADGSDKQWLTAGPGTLPSWSPDGTRIAFTRERQGSDIYLIDASGSNQQRLTHTDAEGTDTLVYDPEWSPDGTQILCVVEYNPDGQFFGQTTLHVLDVSDALQGAGSARLRALPRAGSLFNDWPAWSPDGSQIAFSAVSTEGGGHRDIYVINTDGTNLQQLTLTEDVDELGPAWSPDGTRIVFQANPNGNWDIYVMNVEDALQGADGTDPRPLTTDTESDVDPDWCR